MIDAAPQCIPTETVSQSSNVIAGHGKIKCTSMLSMGRSWCQRLGGRNGRRQMRCTIGGVRGIAMEGAAAQTTMPSS